VTKPQSKVGEAEKKREARSLVQSALGTVESLDSALDNLVTGFTPSARREILAALVQADGARPVSPEVITTICERLWPPKKAKKNGEYVGALFSAMAALAGQDKDSSLSIDNAVLKMIRDLAADGDGVLPRDQLPTVATTFRGGEYYLLRALEPIVSEADNTQLLSLVWTYMVTPLLGLKSSKDIMSSHTAAQILEVSLSTEKWKLAEEHILILPRLAFLGGAASIEMLAESEHASWCFDTSSCETSEEPRQSLPGSPLPKPHELLPSQTALLEQMATEFHKSQEILSSLRAEMETVLVRAADCQTEVSELKRELNSLEIKSRGESSQLRAELASLKSAAAQTEVDLIKTQSREQELQTEVSRIMHQAGTVKELEQHRVEEELEAAFKKPLEKLRNVVNSAQEKNPEIREFIAVSAQLGNCLRKSEQYMRSISNVDGAGERSTRPDVEKIDL
jgi:hypothetical protein